MRVVLRSLKLKQEYLPEVTMRKAAPTRTTIMTSITMITAMATRFQNRIRRHQNGRNPMILTEHQAGGTALHRTRCFPWTKHSS